MGPVSVPTGARAIIALSPQRGQVGFRRRHVACGPDKLLEHAEGAVRNESHSDRDCVGGEPVHVRLYHLAATLRAWGAGSSWTEVQYAGQNGLI